MDIASPSQHVSLPSRSLEWRERAREVANRSVRPLAAHYDRVQEYPWEIKKALCDAGLMGVWIPEEFGGAGAGVLNLCLVVEELSRACGGVGVLYAVNALGSFPILVAGTDEQKQKYLARIAPGEKLIAFGLSERDAGCDAARPDDPGRGRRRRLRASTATRSGPRTVAPPDFYTVFAVTDPTSRSRRISAILVEKGDPGSRSAASRTRWASAACRSWSCTSATAASRRTVCSAAGRAWASSTR